MLWLGARSWAGGAPGRYPMNIVSGRIIHKETGAGIPRLLIELINVDPAGPPGRWWWGWWRTTVTSTCANLPPGDRVGSVATGVDGSFTLEYESSDVRRPGADEQRPALLLVVRAPEDTDGS